jgi:thiol:disulfide interchange protein DsbA
MIQKVILAMCLILGSHMAVAQEEKYQEGVHYFKLDQAQPPTGVVEVTEIFSYACSHCNTFEPYVQNWKKSIPENVKFTRLPVVFGNRSWEMMARGYIAADMMGIVGESHNAMMDAIWKQRQQFRNLDQLADFYSGFGVEKEAFLANYQSFAADSQLRKSQRDIIQFGIQGTPSMVVNRKYRVISSKDVGSFEAILDVVDFLVEKETKSL